MKAENLLLEFDYHFGGKGYDQKDVIEFAKTYARIQIEKDRENLITENKLTTNGMIAQNIRNRPITLD